jgi:hypothetical protein
VLFSFAFSLLSNAPKASAATGINHQINFQGKLVNTNGTNVTDGTYSIVFSLYTVASAGSNIWTETQTVTVANGIFIVSLGSVTTLPGSVDFNTDNIYLGIKVGADLEMTPRIQFTAVPQAFNSEKLGGLDKTGFIQNQTATTQTADFKINGTGNIGTSLTTPLLQSAAATALTITGNAASTWSTSAGNITLQAGGGSILLGTTTAVQSTNGLTITGGTTLALASTGANAITVDSGTTGTIGIGNTNANAKTITIGNVTGATQIVLNTGSGGVLVNQVAGSQLKVTSNAVVPTTDQLAIDNTGSTGVTTAGVNSLSINYKGGAAAVEAAAERIDLQPGATTGGTWSASRIVQNVTGPATGVTSNGLKLEGPATTGGAGTYNAVNIANIGTVTTAGIVRGLNITGTNSQTAGTVRGIQLNNLTAGAASEIGIDLGSGWDSLVTYNNNTKTIINGTGFVIPVSGGTGIDTSASTGVPSISAGTWSVAATLGVGLGGTGLASYTTNSVLYASAATTISQATASAAQVLLGNATGIPTFTSLTGDVTVGNTGVTAIGANKVLDTMLRQSVNSSVIGRSAGSTGNVADIVAGADGQVLRRIAGALGFGTLDNSSLTAGSFTNITGVGTLGSLTISGAGQPVLSVTSTGVSGNSFNLANSSYTTNGANLANWTFSNTNATATATTVNGLSITPTGAVNGNANANTLNAINLPNVTTQANNTFNALNIGTGYNFILQSPTIDISAAGAITSATGIVSSGAVQFSALTTNGVLHTSAANGTLAVSAVLLGSEVSGTLPILNGGTNATSFAATNGSVYFDGTRLVSTAASTVANQCLITASAGGAPSWAGCPASETLQQAYAVGAGGTTPHIAVSTTKGALSIQDSATNTITGNLLEVRAAAANDITLGAVQFAVTNTGNTTTAGTLTVQGTGNSTVAGNLIVGGTISNPELQINTSTAGLDLGLASSNGAFSNIALTNDAVLRANTGSLILAARNASGNIYLTTGAADSAKLTVLSNGNVGIGTATPGNVLSVVGTTTVNSGSYSLTANTLTVSPSSAPAAGTAYVGLQGIATTSSSNANANTQLYGSYSYSQNTGTATLGAAAGVLGGALNTAGGIVTSAYGLSGLIQNTGAGSITTAYTLFANSPTVSAGSIGTADGIFIGPQKVSGVTTGYGVYQAGASDLNYFAGSVGIGTANPTNKLQISGGNIGLDNGNGIVAVSGASLLSGPGGSTFIATPGSSAATGFIIRGVASQSGDLQNWQNSSSTILGKIDANGNLGQGNGTAIFNIAAGLSAGAVRVEEATTNLVTNPSFEVDTTSGGWGMFGTSAPTTVRSTTRALVGTASALTSWVTGSNNGTAAYGITGATLSITSGNTYAFSAYVYVPAGSTAVDLAVYGGTGAFSGGTVRSPISTVTGQWQRLTGTAVATGTGTATFQLEIANGSNAAAGSQVYLDGVQFEQKTYSTTYADGSLGNGYSWSGTAHASTSNRAAGGFVADSTVTTGGINATGNSYLGYLNLGFNQFNLATSSLFGEIGFNYNGKANANFNFYNGSGTSEALLNGTNGNLSLNGTLTAVAGAFINGSNPALSLNSSGGQLAVATSAGSYSTSAAVNDVVLRNNAASGNIILQQGAGAAQLFLQGSTGNIGLGGNVSPTYKLDVTGTVRTSQEFIATLGSAFGQLRMISGNYGSFFRNDGASTYFMLTASGDQYGAWNSLRPIQVDDASGAVYLGAQALTVLNGGNVGIGQTSPTSLLSNTNTNQLDVFGSGNNANSLSWTVNGAGSAVNILNNSTAASANGVLVNIAGTTSAARVLEAESGGVSRLVVRGDGNVGIGNASPGSKLTVSGVTSSTDLIVTNNYSFGAQVAADTSVQGSLQFTTTHSSTGNLYTYQRFTATGVAYTIVSGDTIEYDVYCSPTNTSSVCDGGIDIAYTDASYQRSLTYSDQNFIQTSSGNVSAYAAGRWYHRKASLTAAAGKIINYGDLVEETDVAGTYTNYYRHVVVTNGSTLKTTLWDSGVPTGSATDICSGCSNVSIKGSYYKDQNVDGMLTVNATTGFNSGGSPNVITANVSDDNTAFLQGGNSLITNVSAPGSANSASVFGNVLNLTTDGSKTIAFTGDLFAVIGQLAFNGSASTSTANLYGVMGKVQNFGGPSGTIANAIGIAGGFQLDNGTTVTNAYSVRAVGAQSGSSAGIQNAYGVYINNVNYGTTTNYSLYSAGGQNYFAGAVGIGVVTPSYKLDVSDTQASNYVAHIQNSNTTNTAKGLLIDLGFSGLAVSSNFIGFSHAGSVGGKINQTNGTNVAYSTNGADYAEYFQADPASLPQPGELVSLAGSDNTVARANQTAPMGIISTAPGFVGNGPICKVDDNNCDADYQKYNVLVSLSGQVPVKVSVANGAIQAGDPITSSSTPGVGQKATTAGRIVGYALGGTTVDGTVQVLVSPTYFSPTDQLQAGLLSGTTLQTTGDASIGGSLNVASDVNVGGLATIGSLNVKGSAVFGANVTVKGSITIEGGLTVAGPTSVQDITINGHIITAGSAPIVEMLSAAGSAHATATVSGNDTSGTITITVGDPAATAAGQTPAITGPSIGDLLKLHFAKTYGKQPRIIINGNDGASAKLIAFPNASASDSFDLSIANQPTANTTYSFTYYIVE